MARTSQTSRNVPKTPSKKPLHTGTVTKKPVKQISSFDNPSSENTPFSPASKKGIAKNAARKNATPIRKFHPVRN